MNWFLVAAVAVAAVAAYSDFRTGTIPNWITYPALVIGPIAHAALFSMKGGSSDLALFEGAYSIGGAVVCAIVPVILYRQNALGGGDLKLFAALGAICQPNIGVEIQMYAFIAATVIAPARLAYEGKLFQTVKNAGTLIANMLRPKEKRESVDESAMSWFRMGPAVLVGTLLAAFLHRGAP
jgi:prepilin peptidase CpaA